MASAAALRRLAAAGAGPVEDGALHWLLSRYRPRVRPLLRDVVCRSGRHDAGFPLLPAELAAQLPADWLRSRESGLLMLGRHNPIGDMAARATSTLNSSAPPEEDPEGVPTIAVLERAVECWLDDPQQDREAAQLLEAVGNPHLGCYTPVRQEIDWPWGGTADFGAIQLRHVSSPEHAELWEAGYKHLRAAYPSAPVVIVDDNSDAVFASTMASVTSGDALCAVVAAPRHLTGRGELLMWWCLWTFRPFSTALLLHDSMICREGVDVPAAVRAGGAVPLWGFPHDYSCPLLDTSLLSLLASDSRDSALERYVDTDKWRGCFGGAAFASLQCVERMQEEYGVLGMMQGVASRTARMSAERVLGGVLSLLREPGGDSSCFGDIVLDYPRPWGYTWQDYKAEGCPRVGPIMKIWAGR
eukprot:Hpha_TRINITY_DN2488_c0_g1::TRINITY_DN2488_c0_g1_i1::g.24711::m.24711